MVCDFKLVQYQNFFKFDRGNGDRLRRKDIFGRYFLVVVYPEGVINQLACSFEIPKDAIIRGYIAQR